MSSSVKEDNSPSASFQRLCQNMLDGSSKNLTKKNVEDFRVMLHTIMHECSKANIEVSLAHEEASRVNAECYVLN